FELAKQIYKIPFNESPAMNTFNARNLFAKDKNVGIVITSNSISLFLNAEKEGLNWDMAQYPSYKDRPNVFGYVDTNLIAITKNSKYKDQAMLALDVFTSSEVQRIGSGSGKLSPLKDPEIKKHFGADIP